MKVKITRPTFVDGEPVSPGAVLDASEVDGRNLLTGGKAVPVADGGQETAPFDRENDGADASTRG